MKRDIKLENEIIRQIAKDGGGKYMDEWKDCQFPFRATHPVFGRLRKYIDLKLIPQVNTFEDDKQLHQIVEKKIKNKLQKEINDFDRIKQAMEERRKHMTQEEINKELSQLDMFFQTVK